MDGLLDPTLDRLAATLLGTARDALGPDHPAPAIGLEQWALDLADTSFADGEMPRDFYVDLGRTLAGSPDDLAPPALAALALALRHRDAAPLRKARADWQGAHADGLDADLGLGREVPVRAVTIAAEGEDQVSVVVGFAAAGTAHAVGLLVDDALDGVGRDLFIGPPIEVIELDAGADPDLVVTEIPVAEAAERMRRALDLAVAEDWDEPRDLRLLPLLGRRLDLIDR